MNRLMRTLTLSMALCMAAVLGTAAMQASPFVGMWNMTGTGQDAANVYTLEIKDANGTLSGMFLNRSGNPVPLAYVRVDNGELVFQGGTAERPTGPIYRAKLESGRLVGQHTIAVGGGRGRANDPNAAPAPPPSERAVNWIGTRAATFPASNANGKHTYGAPVVLFDGKTLDAWGLQNPTRPIGWKIADGIATNEAGANNLVSKMKFTDFKVEAEYKLTEHSNSGIYLRGRYELQLLDDAADTTTKPELRHMAIYGRKPTDVTASKASGEWQTMEAIVVGNRVTATLNGKRVHDNAQLVGITGGALDNDELAPGPLMVQGDHTGVAFRKIVVTPITKAGK
jgi:hypothetical protein